VEVPEIKIETITKVVERKVPQYKEVVKEKIIQVEVPVTQIEYVDVPVTNTQYRNVPKYVEVEVPVPVHIRREVPFDKIIEVPVDQPIEVEIERQIQVPVPVTRTVHQYIDIPVDEPVEQIIKSVREVKVPVRVERKVQVPKQRIVQKTQVMDPLIKTQNGIVKYSDFVADPANQATAANLAMTHNNSSFISQTGSMSPQSMVPGGMMTPKSVAA
jgi:hypothetical protein